eukprot:8945643-Lingulodinium_polyedra.AAC.1
MTLGVVLFREYNWSTSTVEQARASVQMLRRRHPDYDLASVLFRAGVRVMRKLVAQVDKVARPARQLRRKLDRLVSRFPQQ